MSSSSDEASQDGWLTCPGCEAPCRDRDLEPGTSIRCVRCGTRVRIHHRIDAIQHGLAIATAGLLLIVLANTEPLLIFDVYGNKQENLIITGVIGLDRQGYAPIGWLVFFCAILAPALYFASIWYALAGCIFRRRWPGLLKALHFAKHVEPWCLTPIFAIACFVAVVKLETLGDVYWKQGTLWVVALGVCTLLLGYLVDPHAVRERLEADRK